MKVYNNIHEFEPLGNAIATIGTFDGVHVGHQKIIGRLRQIAEEENGEVVLLTFFPHPRMVLQPDNDLKLITTQLEKIRLLERYGVDHLVIHPFSREFSRLTAVEYVRDILVNALGIKRLVIGYDHHFGRNREGDLSHLVELSQLYGFDVEEIPAQEIEDVNVSSTKIRRAILSGDMATASTYLGHEFSLGGKVVEGKRLGRTLGYPTANIKIAEGYKILPMDGVYAVRVRTREQTYKGMMNIGLNPTIGPDGPRTIEVNIFDFDEDIYGHDVQLDFVRRIRDEEKFDSLDALKTALDRDKEVSLQLLRD